MCEFVNSCWLLYARVSLVNVFDNQCFLAFIQKKNLKGPVFCNIREEKIRNKLFVMTRYQESPLGMDVEMSCHGKR